MATDTALDTRRARRRAIRTRRRSPWRSLARALLAFALLLIAGLTTGTYLLNQHFASRIYPNIAIRGVDVGGKTAAEAVAALEERHAAFLHQPITLTYGQHIWRPSLKDLGVQLQIGRAVEQAQQAGSNKPLLERLRLAAAIWQRGIELPLRMTIDQGVMRRYVLERAGEVERGATDAQLLVQGSAITTRAAVVGARIVPDETVRDMTAALQTLRPQAVALRTQSVMPALNDAEAAAAQRQVETLLQGPLSLVAGDREYTWSVEDIAQMVQVRREGDVSHPRLAVGLDTAAIAARVRTIADDTTTVGTNPRLDWNGGDLRIVQPGTPGRRVDEPAAVSLIVAAAQGSARRVDLPFRAVEPPVTQANLQQLGIKEVVAAGRSDFAGSADYRITNITAGMRRLDGVLIAPGEQFSFNATVGEIDAANGFVEGYAIIQNRTQLEWGGGICQVSTTMFRAAFWAGLPITERNQHSFYIKWYDKYGYGTQGDGPGLDAAIYTGVKDLRFVNDTGNWLLVETITDTGKALAEVRLYGTKPDRSVRVTSRIYDRTAAPTAPVYLADPERPAGAPKQSDTARGGMTIDAYRVVSDNGVERAPELFQTIYQPWPNIYLYNPADLDANGKPQVRPSSEPSATPASADPALPPMPSVPEQSLTPTPGTTQ